VVAGASGSLHVLDAEPAGSSQQYLACGDRGLLSLSVAPDGKTLAALDRGGEMWLWDVNTGRPVLTLPRQHLRPASVVRFSPDSTTLVTGCIDGLLPRWDFATRKPLPAWGFTGEPFLNLVVRPGGTEWLSLHDGGGTVQWDGRSGEHLPRVPLHPDGRSCAWSSDGRVLAVCGPEVLRLWRVETGEVFGLPIPRNEWYTRLAFSPDGRTLAGAHEQTVRLWDLVEGRPGPTLTVHQGRVSDIAFTRDGRTLVTASEDGPVTLWHVATRREMLSLDAAPRGTVKEVAFSPDGNTLAAACTTADERGAVALWRVTGW
jgi:WD40 repeat protein